MITAPCTIRFQRESNSHPPTNPITLKVGTLPRAPNLPIDTNAPIHRRQPPHTRPRGMRCLGMYRLVPLQHIRPKHGSHSMLISPRVYRSCPRGLLSCLKPRQHIEANHSSISLIPQHRPRTRERPRPRRIWLPTRGRHRDSTQHPPSIRQRIDLCLLGHP
jgi:hypothetical protein